MTRLDLLCVSLGFAESRTKSKNLILEGKVSVNGKTVKKPSELVDENAEISLDKSEFEYVSRGALKLIGALDNFNIDVCGMVAADIGASTGGFTQVLISRGAKKVFAVDVGTNQLHPSVKKGKRTKEMNAKKAAEKHAEHTAKEKEAERLKKEEEKRKKE